MPRLTRQQGIERIRDWVGSSHITRLDELEKECKKVGVHWFDDILGPMGWNCCDRCGQLGCSDYGDFLWVDSFEWEDDNPFDQAILLAIEEEGQDYCALCWECVDGLKKRGIEIQKEKSKKY